MKRNGFVYDEHNQIISYTFETYNRLWNEDHTSFRSVPSGQFITHAMRYVDESHVEFIRRTSTGEKVSKIVKVVGKGSYEFVYKALKTQINVQGNGATSLFDHFSKPLWANTLSAMCDHAIDNMRAA